MSDVVYPTSDLVVSWSQGQTALRRTEAWSPDAALVRERPDLFEAEPSKVTGQPRVERATRAPGEQRGPQGQDRRHRR